MEIRNYLVDLGLDEKEILVYLASLEIGETLIMPIVDKVNLPRTTVFHILERLRDQRLVEIVRKGRRHIYIPYPPRHLATLMKQERDRLSERLESFQTFLPEFSRIYSSSSFEPKIRFFKGLEIRRIYDEILEMPIDEEWYVGESEMIVETLGEQWLANWIKKRINKGIRARTIRVKSKESQKPIFGGGKDFLRKVRYAPEDFSSPAHVLIYGDNVAYLTTQKESFGFVVTSRETADTMRNWFRQLWKVSSER